MKRVVAWYNRTEWVGVYNDLFSTDPVSQRHGVDRVTVWKCRVLHRLSTAIECTSELVRAQLLDLQYTEDIAREQEVRLTLAMALIRFVNLITEKSQTEDYAQSVHSVAQQVGLPEWLVDLRHDATHSSLPSIHILRTALSTALNWIKVNYWEAQILADEEDEPLSKHTHNTAQRPQPLDSYVATGKAQKLIQQYVNCHLQTYKQRGEESPKVENSQSRAIVDDLEKLLNTNREEVVKVCIQDGCLINTTEQLIKMNVDTNAVKALIKSKDLTLPKEVVTTWRPLLKLFQQKNLTDGLLQALSMTLTEDCDLRNRLICGWIGTIITHAQDAESYKKNERLYKKGFEVNCRAVMETLVTKPSRYTLKALSRLLRAVMETLVTKPSRYTLKALSNIFSVSDCGLSPSQQSRLTECMQMYTKCNSRQTGEGNVYTLEQLTGASVSDVSEKAENLGETSISGAAWNLCTDILDWSKYPLGTCPGVAIDYCNLDLQTGNKATINRSIGYIRLATRILSPADLEDCEDSMETDVIETSKSEKCSDACHWTEKEVKTIAESIELF